MSAVWDGSHAYIFGGHDGTNYLDDIVQFNPSTGTVTTLTSKLPSADGGTSAIWDGKHAYIFSRDDIIRFNPRTGTVTTLTSKLPSTRWSTSAVWDGSHAYIFGGHYVSYLGDIVRFTPPWPVGGVVTPVNKLVIFAPYIALAGLIAAVSTVYVIRRRKA